MILTQTVTGRDRCNPRGGSGPTVALRSVVAPLALGRGTNPMVTTQHPPPPYSNFPYEDDHAGELEVTSITVPDETETAQRSNQSQLKVRRTTWLINVQITRITKRSALHSYLVSESAVTEITAHAWLLTGRSRTLTAYCTTARSCNVRLTCTAAAAG